MSTPRSQSPGTRATEPEAAASDEGDARVTEAVKKTPLGEFVEASPTSEGDARVTEGAAARAEPASPQRHHHIDDYVPVPAVFKIIAGDWGDWCRTTQNMFIVIAALIGTSSLSLVLFEAAYAMAVICITFGALYLVLPHDIIPDQTTKFGLPIGKFDDAILGGGPIAIGISLVVTAVSKSPMEPLFVAFIVALLVVAIFGYINENFRFFCIGIWAMFGQFAFWANVFQNSTIAVGVGLYCFGFIYNSLPVDFIDERRWPTLGKVDDVILGYVPVVLGFLFLLASGVNHLM
jgi:uncharacterized membrane protein YkvA (DUF1232 family)